MQREIKKIKHNMKIQSTNIAKPTAITWKGKEEYTGIYKTPVSTPIYLTKNKVTHDEISDTKHHGGYYQAVYAFAAEQYPYWKTLYPHLIWNWGMFGENITLQDFDEKQVFIGDIYRVGNALVQVSQYREPCYKLGYKFDNQNIVKQFIDRGHAGTYLSVIEEGNVEVGNIFNIQDRIQTQLSVYDLFQLGHTTNKNKTHLKIAAESECISEKKRAFFRSFL